MKLFGKRDLIFAFLLLPGMVWAQAGTDLVLGEGTEISLQLNDNLSTKGNSEGDSFTATVLEPVLTKEKIVIPKGSIISGTISRLIGPGRFKGKAVMNLLFNSVLLPNTNEPLPITASLVSIESDPKTKTREEGTISRDGSKGKDATKVAAPAITGAGIGAIVGGGKGAAIGAGVGAAAGLASILAGRGKDLEVRRGSTLNIVLDRPLTVPAEVIRRAERR